MLVEDEEVDSLHVLSHQRGVCVKCLQSLGRKLTASSLQASHIGDLVEGQGCASVWQYNADSNNLSKAFSTHMQRIR